MGHRFWRKWTLIVAGALYVVLVLAISVKAAPEQQSIKPAPLSTQDPSSLAPPLPAKHTGENIFRATCATCHGVDGKGSPQSVVGFDKPLPDFTDCSFATAEARADWQSVVHEGGPIRALDHHMPKFGDALSKDDIVLAVEYIKSFCTDKAWPQGDLNFPRVFFTEKAFPEDEAVLTTGVTSSGAKAVENDFEYERRIGSRAQLSVEVPFDAQQTAPASDWQHGLGDVEVALKRTLYSSVPSGGIVAVGGAVTFPTGNVASGLGQGVKVYEPFFLYDQRLAPNWFVQTQTGFKFSSNQMTVANNAYFNSGIGTSIATDHSFGRVWTPQVEVLWARSNGAVSQWDIVPQMQVTLVRSCSAYVNAWPLLAMRGGCR